MSHDGFFGTLRQGHPDGGTGRRLVSLSVAFIQRVLDTANLNDIELSIERRRLQFIWRAQRNRLLSRFNLEIIKRKNMIFKFYREHFVPKENIPYLPGGEIRGPEYFVVTEEGDVMQVKLRVQSATQISPAFPEGYEPFVSLDGEISRFCIATQSIPIRGLSVWTKFGAVYSIRRVSAAILRPRHGSEEWVVLSRYAKRFELQNYIRNFVARNKALFPTVLDLLADGNWKTPPTLRECISVFECRLKLAQDTLLTDLVGLLKMDAFDPARQSLAA